MENQPKLNSSKEVITFLAERFPLCFTTVGEARPLKIGIFQDLAESVLDQEKLSKTQLRAALHLYTSSWRYLYGIKVGAQRVDLNGDPCGVLEDKHIEHARKRLIEAKARVRAQRAEQQAKKGEAIKKTIERQPCLTKTKGKTTQPRKTGVMQEGLPQGEGNLSPPLHPDRPPAKKSQPRSVPVTDISTLKVGQEIKVKVGLSAKKATILEIAKDGVRIQLPSGLAMIVRAKHLQC